MDSLLGVLDLSVVVRRGAVLWHGLDNDTALNIQRLLFATVSMRNVLVPSRNQASTTQWEIASLNGRGFGGGSGLPSVLESLDLNEVR